MAPVKVLQLVDDSDCSEYAFKWAQDHVLLPRKGEHLSLVAEQAHVEVPGCVLVA